ncbi:unnamed protein product [Prunus armeniaca]
MINKAEVYSIFVHFHAYLVTQFSASLKVFQSDGGSEYLSHKFQHYLLARGIIHHKFCPYTPEQNGLAERKHRHILETVITLLQTAHLPPKFWFHACATSVYLINRMPCKTLHFKSPYFLLFEYAIDITHLRVFGCACFPLLKPYNTDKLQPKTSTCVFLGYAGQYKGYICFSLTTNRLFVTKHVLFDETVFPFTSVHPVSISSSQSLPSSSPPPSISFTNTVLSPIPSLSISSPSPPTFEATEPLNALPPGSLPASPFATQFATQSPLLVDPDFQPENLRVVLPLPPVNLHLMTTRSKNGISKRKAFSASTSVDLSTIEPSSFKVASQSPEWQSAMREEIEALHAQGTWDLVPLPAHKNLVGCKCNSSIITSVIGALTQEFDTKDLAQLTYFLGLQISYQFAGLFASQTKYIKELLDKVDLQDSKLCPTPCLPYHRLLKDDSKPYSYPEQYRSIVGALQYLTFDRAT